MTIIFDEDDEILEHYGIIRRSGRYPWGSGGNNVTRSRSFFDHLKELLGQGMSESEIAKGWGMTTTELRATKSIARAEMKAADIAQAEKLRAKGWSTSAIARRMERNESSIRAMLAPGEKEKADSFHTVANALRGDVAKYGLLDVGTGVERLMGVSRTKLDTAIAMLIAEGYSKHLVKFDQLGTGHQTEMKVLAPPGVTQKDAWLRRNEVRVATSFSEDNGKSILNISTPLSINSKRVAVRYKEDGGDEADGVIYVRPGVKDVSLGGARYAQVRIAVDGTHYLKGMAMYKDDLPPGVDLQFNTNKSSTGNKLDAMKPMERIKRTGEIDPDNPFGSFISRQIFDKDNPKQVSSAMNIVNEEGKWGDWSKNLSTQFLSKQSPTLIRRQLDATYKDKTDEFNEIMRLTNPAVKQKLLESFADDVDASAVHMKAKFLPRQATHVILPLDTLKASEVYAPNYKDGEKVVLVRYPHGGIFELPELTVNNKNPQGRRLLGTDTPDAIGIHSDVAKRLSGADFDGDTVLVIPNNSGSVKTSPALAQLKDFDPQVEFKGYPGMKKISAHNKQVQMGVVSNLITDMTIAGAPHSDIARAVRHSMVVIDAEKHGLDYKRSAAENGIAQLKKKYQVDAQGDASGRAGASTLISRAKAKTYIEDRKPRLAKDGGPIDPATGKKVFVPTGRTVGRTVVDKETGQTTRIETPRLKKVKRLEIEDDASVLTSGPPGTMGTAKEALYANHSNRLKALANTARKEMLSVPNAPYSPSAQKVFAAEVRSLNTKLDTALRNRPLERQAQLLATTNVKTKRDQYPDMDKAELKKIKAAALTEARNRVGAEKVRVDITDDEWVAIQAGAISNHKLRSILDNTEDGRVKELATPRKPTSVFPPAKISKAKSLIASGKTQAEVAQILGIGLTTLKNGLKGA